MRHTSHYYNCWNLFQINVECRLFLVLSWYSVYFLIHMVLDSKVVWSSGAAWLNAVDSMQYDWMQWILCSMAQSILIECSGFHAAWLIAGNPCSLVKCIPIECSGFYAAWLNAVDSMQREEMEPYWMQWILCSMIECSGFHAAWLNAVCFMQHGPKHPDWMQWIPCNIIECRAFHALWHNGSRLYAVESMQWGKCIPIKCSGVYAPIGPLK